MSEPNTNACLTVGVAAYFTVNPLPASVINDAKAVHALLTDPQVCAYPPENAQLLLDGQATAAAIRQAMQKLAECSDKDGTVFIYFSGHGFHIPSGKNQDAYLLPVDTNYSTRLELVRSAIAGSQFTDMLRAIPAKKVVVVFDCCHAGGIGQPKDLQPDGIKSGLPEQYYQQLASGRGRVIMASSRETEASWVMPAASNSLFTKHLLNGLRGQAASSDGLVRIFNLYEYIQPKVTAEQPEQHPIFKAEIEENFPLAFGGTPKTAGVLLPADEAPEDGFEFDAYISYLDEAPDAGWVWDVFLPTLEAAGLKIAVSGDVEKPGVARVVNIERGIKKARRTLVALSDAYLRDHGTEFENTLAQSMGIQEGNHRVIPVYHEAVDLALLPVRLGMLSGVNLAHPQRGARELQRLLVTLQSPL